MMGADAHDVPIETGSWTPAKTTVDGEVTGGSRLVAVRSATLAAAALRRRGESIRVATIARYRGPLSRPELAEDISRRVVDAVLAPVLSALEGVRGGRRRRALLDAAWELFDLDDWEPH